MGHPKNQRPHPGPPAQSRPDGSTYQTAPLGSDNLGLLLREVSRSQKRTAISKSTNMTKIGIRQLPPGSKPAFPARDITAPLHPRNVTHFDGGIDSALTVNTIDSMISPSPPGSLYEGTNHATTNNTPDATSSGRFVQLTFTVFHLLTNWFLNGRVCNPCTIEQHR